MSGGGGFESGGEISEEVLRCKELGKRYLEKLKRLQHGSIGYGTEEYMRLVEDGKRYNMCRSSL